MRRSTYCSLTLALATAGCAPDSGEVTDGSPPTAVVSTTARDHALAAAPVHTASGGQDISAVGTTDPNLLLWHSGQVLAAAVDVQAIFWGTRWAVPAYSRDVVAGLN